MFNGVFASWKPARKWPSATVVLMHVFSIRGQIGIHIAQVAAFGADHRRESMIAPLMIQQRLASLTYIFAALDRARES